MDVINIIFNRHLSFSLQSYQHHSGHSCSNFILKCRNVSRAALGLLIGIALGTLLTGLRLFGVDRPYGGN
jgi:hypothetical protein